ncbi:hypothetical protein N9B45_01750, partial [bacterium]|nr:hypothetical protein [bacterium]
GESLVVSDLIQRIYTNDGQGDGRITPQGFEVMSALSGMGMSGIFGRHETSIEYCRRSDSRTSHPVARRTNRWRRPAVEKPYLRKH